jgi:hypothetical protein
MDASVILARQLIGALLNIAHGSNPGPVCTTIAAANGLLVNCTLPCKVSGKSALGHAMIIDANILASYNSGGLTSGCTP